VSACRRILLTCTLALLAGAPPVAHGQTVVSLTFDDGAASQLQAQPLLLAHRMRGTFYIISGTVGSNSYYMTWPQITSLAATGNEIGGHTVTHPHLTQLKTSQAKQEICGSRTALQAHGFDAVSFAYPYGDFNTTVEGLVNACGYVTARRVGGLSHPGCGSCLPAESLPPGDPYAVRSNAADVGAMTLAELQGYVMQAENAGGGWVPLTFHDICSNCPPTSEDSSITPSDFAAFLDWLAARAPSTIVKSVRGAMGLPEPDLPPLPAPPVVATAAPPPDKVTAFAAVRVRRKQRFRHLQATASMPEPGTLSANGTVNVRSAAKVYRFKTVRKAAVAGVMVKLPLRLTKKGRRAVARALRRHRRLVARLTITARDAAGNLAAQHRSVRLTR
jgi:peptidoglycan/xylan/chitin deacetylase (PgdA/CDA1 family)